MLKNVRRISLHTLFVIVALWIATLAAFPQGNGKGKPSPSPSPTPTQTPTPSPTPTPEPTPEPTPIVPCYFGAGCFDSSFGINGMSLTFVSSSAHNPGKAALQSDGKILALMWPLLNSGTGYTGIIIRYNVDGSVDHTFGSAGFVYLNWNAGPDYQGLPFAIAVQTVGGEERIVVAGTGSGFYTTPLRVDRFLSDGSVDTSFGTGGSTSVNIGMASSIAIQPDGKIVTGGGALARFNVNGTLDTTFGNGGSVQNSAGSIALQSDGKIVAAGSWTALDGTKQMSVWRFNTNGSLDDGRRNSDSTPGDSFGDKGQRKIAFSGNADVSSVKISSDGKIVVAGWARAGVENNDFAAARLTTSGAIDSTFGTSGKVTVDFNGRNDNANGISISSTGKLVMVGHTMSTSTNRNIGLVRLNSNGSLDMTFGQGGKAVADSMQTGEFTSDGMIQIDPTCSCEKIIAVGSASSGGLRHSMVARFLF